MQNAFRERATFAAAASCAKKKKKRGQFYCESRVFFLITDIGLILKYII